MDPFRVFVFYHLGLDEHYQYKFRNIHDAARNFRTSPEALNRFLAQHGMDATTFRHIDFNLAVAHADAQILDLEARPFEERDRFARRKYDEFRAALKTYRKDRTYEDIDYDDPLGIDKRRR